jgi:hypothetical protein
MMEKLLLSTLAMLPLANANTFATVLLLAVTATLIVLHGELRTLNMLLTV